MDESALPPVVSDDRGWQHTGEQPTKLSQSVEEGPVVGFHTGVLEVTNKSRLSSVI